MKLRYLVLLFLAGLATGPLFAQTFSAQIETGTTWAYATSASVAAGATVNLSAYPQTGSLPTTATYSWVGPNGFTASTREIDKVPLAAGANVFTLTITISGKTQTLTITITEAGVTPPPTPTPIVPELQTESPIENVSAVTITAGQTVTLEPGPATGGTWNWTGPSGFTSTSRIVSVVPTTTSTYTATYTNAAGAPSTQAFVITVTGSTPPPVASVKGISCASATVTGAASDVCTVTLSAAATAATTVTLASSSTSVAVPASVSVSTGATTGTFTASAGAVTTATTATLTATLNGSTTTTVTDDPPPVTVAYTVILTWSAPASSTDPVAGYKILRAASSSGPFTALFSTPITVLTYTDSSVVAGDSYSYEAVSVDASGNQSAPSNVFTATIP